MTYANLTYCHKCYGGYPLCKCNIEESRGRLNAGDIYLLAAHEIWKSFGDINLEEILQSFQGQPGTGHGAGQRSPKMEQALLPPVEYPAKGKKPRVIEKRRFESYGLDELDDAEVSLVNWEESARKWKEYNDYLQKTVDILIDIYIGSY